MNTLPPHADGGNPHYIIIPITKNQFTLVDFDDADLAEQHWCDTGNGYAGRTTMHNRKTVITWMHRVVLERKLGRPIKEGLAADHINRNKLDNRRSNLREATLSQNSLNASSFTRLSHGFKGLRVEKRANGLDRYGAYLRSNGSVRYLGSFDTPKEASLAYDKAALEEHGEFVRLNNPIEEVRAWQPTPINPRPKHERGFRGIRRYGKRWAARLRAYGHLGMFATPEEAARTYDRAALKAYGVSAKLNFPREDYERCEPPEVQP